MDLMQLVALAEQESEGNLASGSQPQRGSARRFLSQPSCSRRQRAFGRRSLSKGQARNVKKFSIQAEAANSLGRGRTLDHLIPTDACEDRPRPKGKGQWKVWTPETMLRAAFQKRDWQIGLWQTKWTVPVRLMPGCAAASWLDALTGCRKLAGRGA